MPLADRAATHAPLDNPGDVVTLLDSLQRVGSEQQVTAVADRAATHASLGRPGGVARLLDALRQAGAEQQAAALADRLPGSGLFELFREQESRQDQFRFGREADGSPAEPWGWEDLD